MVDLCITSPSWFGWIKAIWTVWNCICWLITFSISLSYILRSTIGQNDLGESYFFLFGFEIMTDVDCLKWDGQYPSSKHALVIFRVLFIYLLYTRIFFKCLHEIWSRSGIELFLHFLRVSLNSCSMNLSQVWVEASWSSLRISWLTG